MLCKNLNCELIRVYSRDEFKQKHSFQADHIRYILGDVRDKERLDMALEEIDIVIHVAALKQIDTGEYNPFEFIKTNIYGTQNVIECAMRHNIDQVLLISTDKAVNPINLYGATKLCAEKLIISANNYRGHKKTQFKYVRYGNVWGSRGSVLDTWMNTGFNGFELRDRHATRYHLTLDMALELIIKVLTNNKIMTLPSDLKAYNLGDLANVFEDITHKIGNETELLPEEKLHETLDGITYSNTAPRLKEEELKSLVSNYMNQQ